MGGWAVAALALAVAGPLSGCGGSSHEPADRPLRQEDKHAAAAALKRIHAPSGFHETAFACAKSEDLPWRCFKNAAVMPDRSRRAVEQLLRSFGLKAVSLRCEVSPPGLAATSSRISCDGSADLGHFTVAVIAMSGRNKAKQLSGTQVALSIVRVND